MNSLGGNGSPKLGTVATVVAAANSTAMESAKEIEAAMRISMRAALGMLTNRTTESGQLDDLTIMKVYIISISWNFNLKLVSWALFSKYYYSWFEFKIIKYFFQCHMA